MKQSEVQQPTSSDEECDLDIDDDTNYISQNLHKYINSKEPSQENLELQMEDSKSSEISKKAYDMSSNISEIEHHLTSMKA